MRFLETGCIEFQQGLLCCLECHRVGHLHHPVIVCSSSFCFCLFEPVVDFFLELYGRDGFGEIVVHSCVNALFHVTLDGVGRDTYDRGVNAGFLLDVANGLGCLQPVHLRHRDIHQDQGWMQVPV